MNDHLPEQLGVLKKFVSYPSKIERVLIREADSWPDTRMHKAESACFDFVNGRPEQFDMMMLAMVDPERLKRAEEYAFENGCEIFDALDDIRREEPRHRYRRQQATRPALPPRRPGEERNTRRYIHPPSLSPDESAAG
ncbi:hypothetical protein [Sinorhizobium fredii]|uniref:hypothetical protein n=1 Tax=Rhizobium fredii TaxID=380 RepID=UPI003514A390